MADDLYGRLLGTLALGAAILLLGMVVGITADILGRNLLRVSIRGMDEASEYALLAMTMMAAPWLLRSGQHVRLDLLLTALPRRLAWGVEIIGDLVGIVVASALAWYGFAAAMDSRRLGSLVMKTWVFPEWWLLLAFPVCMSLIAIEFIFRLRRLLAGPRGPRGDSTAVA